MMANDCADTHEVRQGHCPKCGPDRYSDVCGFHKHQGSDEYVWWTINYRILVCRGCETPYFEAEEFFSENVEHSYDMNGQTEAKFVPDISYFPSPIQRAKPKWSIDLIFISGESEFGKFEDLFSDIYRCLNADIPVPAAIATRTAFDRASELLGIEPSLSFEKKLDALVELGKISLDERDVLEVLIDAGSAAAHRGWRPKPDELETLVIVLETFVHRTFILGQAATKLKAGVPQRPARKPEP